jgi:hypothetical protein
MCDVDWEKGRWKYTIDQAYNFDKDQPVFMGVICGKYFMHNGMDGIQFNLKNGTMTKDGITALREGTDGRVITQFASYEWSGFDRFMPHNKKWEKRC